MRRGRNTAETSSHPFRSLFDLMLALVLLLLAAFVLRQPKPRTPYDITHRREELLLLHNLRIRQEQGENAPLLTSISQLAPTDICRRLVTNPSKPLTEAERQELEAHRSRLWQEVAPTVRDRLLASRITRTIDQNTLQFPPGLAVPSDTSRLPTILDSVLTQCYDAQHSRILVKRIRVEGHTDNIPIASIRFPSNWELSAARAIWLAKEIEQDLNAHGIATGQNGVLVEAIGYADRFPRPGNDNATEEHRRLNRRIEIVFEK
ncbi:MAG: flagellar motor protein MotB [Chthonomonadaceae bacterium]|nr:flagellar motor protein MotB [Chthonomonadaceae bacterium]